MRLEKEKTEELENRGREQEKLQTELKQLKDFKPTMLLVSSLHLAYECFYFYLAF